MRAWWWCVVLGLKNRQKLEDGRCLFNQAGLKRFVLLRMPCRLFEACQTVLWLCSRRWEPRFVPDLQCSTISTMCPCAWGGWVVVEWPWQSVVCLDVVDVGDGDGIPRSQVGVEKGTNGLTENKGR